MKKIRVGLIGAGKRIQTIYLPVFEALRKDFEITGFVCRSAYSGVRFKEMSGLEAYADLQELVYRTQPDLLIVAVSRESLFETAQNAFQSGCSVLLETPLGQNGKEAYLLKQMAARLNVRVGVCEQKPFLPVECLKKILIDQGIFGNILAVENDFHSFNFHAIAQLRNYLPLNAKPAEIQAMSQKFLLDPFVSNREEERRSEKDRTEKWLLGTVQFDTGQLLIHRFTTQFKHAPFRNFRSLRIYGSRGSMANDEISVLDAFGKTHHAVIQSQCPSAEEAADVLFVEIPGRGRIQWKNPFSGLGFQDDQVGVASHLKAMQAAIEGRGKVLYSIDQAWMDFTVYEQMKMSAKANGSPMQLSLREKGDHDSKKTKVLYLYRRDRARWMEEWKKGEKASDFFYGLPYFDPDRYDVRFIEGDLSKANWRARLIAPVEKWIMKHVDLGFGLDIPWKYWREVKNADVLISTVDACGLPVLLLKRMGLLKTPVIYISQGLSDRMVKFKTKKPRRYRLVRRIYRSFLQQADSLLTFGREAAVHLTDVFGLEGKRAVSIPFGVDADFWTPGEKTPHSSYILSVGSDKGRDYETLIKAAGSWPLKIVTTRLRISVERLPSHVEILSNLEETDLRTLYRNAAFVVTPLRDVAQPSGQSATLQAMAVGKAVILTRTRGLWEPDYLQDREHCFFVNPYDVEGLCQQINDLMASPAECGRVGENARKLIESRYNARWYAKEMQNMIRQILGVKEAKQNVSKLEPAFHG